MMNSEQVKIITIKRQTRGNNQSQIKTSVNRITEKPEKLAGRMNFVQKNKKHQQMNFTCVS